MFPTEVNPEFSNNMNNSQMYHQVNTQWQPAINVQSTPYVMSMSQPVPMQQMPSYCIPLPQTQIQLASNTYTSSTPDYQLQQMTSTSEDEVEDNQPASSNDWQVIRSTKRKKIRKQSDNTQRIETKNRFEILENEVNPPTKENTPKPPPIFIHGVQDYKKMTQQIQAFAENEQYNTKSLANNVVKISCGTPDTYRKLVRLFKEKNIFHHTYQLKEERAYRIVIKYLHHSTNIEDIKEELLKLGHKVRNIINAKHRITKEPLNLFFVDLEPSANNKEIYNIRGLQNRIIEIEPPRTNKNSIIQCMRCQQYGHSKSYCNKPFVCVKCGGAHNTNTCKKSRDTPAKCALCGGDHPANYKGCEHYHKIFNVNNKNHNKHHLSTPTINQNHTQPMAYSQHKSYAQIAANNQNNIEDTASILTKFLEEFKNLFNQLMQQNSMVLNMISMLVNKKN